MTKMVAVLILAPLSLAPGSARADYLEHRFFTYRACQSAQETLKRELLSTAYQRPALTTLPGPWVDLPSPTGEVLLRKRRLQASTFRALTTQRTARYKPRPLTHPRRYRSPARPPLGVWRS